MTKGYKGYVACTFGGGDLPPSFYHRPKKAANSNGDTIKIPAEFFKNKKAFLAKTKADNFIKKVFDNQND